jgi:Na+/glutamate symporter
VFILKAVKVLCFDTLLQVFILKGLTLHKNCAILEAFFVMSEGHGTGMAAAKDLYGR